MSEFMMPVDEEFAPYDHQLAQLRVPPHSTEAESSVLGGLLLDNQAWDRVGDLLIESDFYRFEHRLIYAGIAKLVNASKPADVITVYEHLQSIGKSEEVGGLAYLNALAQYVPSASNIRRYAEIVRERAITPPAWSIHRRPAEPDTPNPSAATEGLTPPRTAAQNSARTALDTLTPLVTAITLQEDCDDHTNPPRFTCDFCSDPN